jgi:Glycosyl-hydrolase 97 C-terminal, oligomerisation
VHSMPASWDETRFLAGHPDTHIVIARRKGETWYVAGLNGQEQTQTVRFRPSDLGIAQSVQLLLAKDGTDRGNNFATDERTVEPTTQIVVDMRYMGGFLARMRAR